MFNRSISLTKRVVCLYPYKQIICLGSQAEYGYYNGPVSENHEPSKLQSEYGVTKLYCLNKLKMYCEAHDIEWQWIRIFTVFGEQMTGGLIKLAIHQCLNSIKKFDTTRVSKSTLTYMPKITQRQFVYCLALKASLEFII